MVIFGALLMTVTRYIKNAKVNRITGEIRDFLLQIDVLTFVCRKKALISKAMHSLFN